MAHKFSRTESRVWNSGLLWRSIYHALVLIDFTCFDKILFCGLSSNPHCIIPGPRKGKNAEVIFAWQEDLGLGRGIVVGVVVLIVGVNPSVLSNLALRFRLDGWILVYIQIVFGIKRIFDFCDWHSWCLHRLTTNNPQGLSLWHKQNAL